MNEGTVAEPEANPVAVKVPGTFVAPVLGLIVKLATVAGACEPEVLVAVRIENAEFVVLAAVVTVAAFPPTLQDVHVPVRLVMTPDVGVPSNGVVKPMLVAVVPLGRAKTPVALALIVALPLVEPSMTTLPPVPPFAPNVILLVPVSVVNAPEPGVVPPIAPGFGNEDVDPPRDTAVPAIVIDA